MTQGTALEISRSIFRATTNMEITLDKLENGWWTATGSPHMLVQDESGNLMVRLQGRGVTDDMAFDDFLRKFVALRKALSDRTATTE